MNGLHMHIGSGTDMEHLAKVCGAMQKAALRAGRSRHLDQCRWWDSDSLSSRTNRPLIWKATSISGTAHRKRIEEEFGHEVTLEIEPGRYLVAESGYLISEIRAVKRTGDNIFYLLDAGFNNLARPVMYGAYHPMSVAPRDGDVRRNVHDVVWAARSASRAISSRRKRAVCQPTLAARGLGGRLAGD